MLTCHLLPLLLLCFTISGTKGKIDYNSQDEFQNLSEEPVAKNDYDKIPPPPPIDEEAKMARYIVHYSDWGSLAHKSFQKRTFGYPVSRIYSISDGLLNNSSGIPYMYVASIAGDVHDLLIDDRCSITASLAEGDYCKSKQMDPEDPKCPQVTLTGRCLFLKNGTAEWNFALEALLTRHPEMKTWPESHGWRIMKPVIESILLVDNVGGNKYPSVDEYFSPSSDPLKKPVSKWNSKSIIEINLII